MRLKIFTVVFVLATGLLALQGQVRREGYPRIGTVSLQGHWPLDENSGTTVNNDAWPGTYNGTTNGVRVKAIFNGGIQVTAASSQRINFGDVCDVGTGDFSFVCWVKYTSNDAGMIAGKWASSLGWYFKRHTDKKIFSKVQDATLNQDVWGDVAETATWYHVALTVNRADPATGLKIYMNGVLKGSGQNATSNISNAADFTVGSLGAGYYANAVFDDIWFFHRVLTPEEVRILYANRPIKLSIGAGSRSEAAIY